MPARRRAWLRTHSNRRDHTVKIFQSDPTRYEGVRPINIYMVRTLFALIFLFVGFDSWSAILRHEGAWDPMRGAALAMFASYALLSILGVFRPLKMLPIFAFVITYKTIWLLVVAYPLWAAGALVGSPSEGMARVFIWIPLAMVAMPWRYFFRTYVHSGK